MLINLIDHLKEPSFRFIDFFLLVFYFYFIDLCFDLLKTFPFFCLLQINLLFLVFKVEADVINLRPFFFSNKGI